MNKDEEFQSRFCISNLIDFYTHKYPCLYWNNLYKGTDIMRKDDAVKSLFDREIKHFCDSFSVKNPEKNLIFIDMLSAYGNVTLSTVFGLKCDEIFKLADTEEKANNLGQNIQRLWNKSEVWGYDISENALNYALSQNVFDKIVSIDINKLLSKELEHELKITEENIKKCHVLFLCSPTYIDENILFKMIEWFAEGTEEGYLIVTMTYPIDLVERSSKIKKYLLLKCEFVNTIPGKHRDFFDEQEKQKYSEIMSFSESWCFKRKI